MQPQRQRQRFSAVPQINKEIPRAEPDRCTFKFYSSEEARALSVKRIHNVVAFDNGNPEAGGLYDPALGPMDQLAT